HVGGSDGEGVRGTAGESGDQDRAARAGGGDAIGRGGDGVLRYRARADVGRRREADRGLADVAGDGGGDGRGRAGQVGERGEGVAVRRGRGLRRGLAVGDDHVGHVVGAWLQAHHRGRPATAGGQALGAAADGRVAVAVLRGDDLRRSGRRRRG